MLMLTASTLISSAAAKRRTMMANLIGREESTPREVDNVLLYLWSQRHAGQTPETFGSGSKRVRSAPSRPHAVLRISRPRRA